MKIINKFIIHKFFITKITLTLSYSILLSLLFITCPSFTVYGQQQNAGSAVNSICNLVQENRLIAGFAGLDQAVNICNNLNSFGSNQALTELCSTISNFNIINIDSYCNQRQELPSGQSQTLNDNNNGINSQGHNENQSSNSFIDRILGFLLGLLGF